MQKATQKLTQKTKSIPAQFLFLLLACFVFPQTANAEKLYTDLGSLRAVDPNESIGGRVDFEAILTHANEMQEFLFVQSGDDAIFVWAPKISTLQPTEAMRVGQRVRVRGKVAKGDLLPIINDAEVEVIGEGVLPIPEKVSKIDVEHDCRYLDFEFEILQSRIKFSSSLLYAKTKNNQSVTIEVMHPNGKGSELLPSFVGERVRFPGVLGLKIGSGAFQVPGSNERNITGYKIFCESPSLLKTTSPIAKRARPPQAIKMGLSHILAPDFPDGHFLTFGQICLLEDTQPPAIIASEGSSFMRLEIASLDDLQTGMVMRIDGAKTTDSLGHANFKANTLRDLAMAEFSQPEPVSIEQAINDFKLNHRISVVGSPKRIEERNGQSVLLLGSSESEFRSSDSLIAVEFQNNATDSLSSIHPSIASQAQVSGILKRDEKFGVKLIVSRATDVTLLQSKASFSRIVMIGLGVLLVACALAGIWIKLLRSKINQKRIFETIFDSAGCPIIVFNGDLQVFDANQVAADMTGYTKAELCSLRVTELDKDLPREKIRAMLARTMANQDVAIFPTQVSSKDNMPLDVEVHVRSLTPSDDLDKATFVAIFPDSTARIEHENELKKARDEAINANKAKSQFVASMSHELRTPLNGVIGMTQLLENTDLTPIQADYLAACRTSGETLLTVIGDVLDFSKLEAGKLKLHTEETDLIPFIENIVRASNLQKTSQQVELGSFVDPRLDRSVMLDSDRLRQVLFNLVGNATKFTAQGSVTLTAKCKTVTEDYADVRFVVADTGIGIQQDRIKRLFRAFEQCDSSTTRQYGGTGLGLTICKQIIDLMQGEIHVESTQGEGSQFIIDVRLPFAKSQQTKDENLDGVDLDLKNQRIAIVGTSGPISELVDEMYRQYQTNVSFFDESEQIPKNEFDVILFNSCNSLATAKDLITKQGKWLTEDGTRLIPIVPANCLVKPQQWDELGVEQPILKPFSQTRLLQPFNSKSESEDFVGENSLSLATLHDRQLRVLVCEDVYVNQMFVKELCRNAGIDCVISENGKVGIQTLQKDNDFDAIFMDCHMPVMDGLKATRKIVDLVDQGMLPKIPIIALTATANSEGLKECLAAGMDDYLTKPFVIQQFLEKLEKHLSISAPRKPKATVPTASLTNTDQIFNMEILLSQIDDRDFVLDLARQFTETFPEYHQALKASLEVQDAQTTLEVAHRIKGAAGMIQAERVRALAAEIEADASDGELQQLQSQIEEMQQEFENFINVYQKQTSCTKHG